MSDFYSKSNEKGFQLKQGQDGSDSGMTDILKNQCDCEQWIMSIKTRQKMTGNYSDELLQQFRWEAPAGRLSTEMEGSRQIKSIRSDVGSQGQGSPKDDSWASGLSY